MYIVMLIGNIILQNCYEVIVIAAENLKLCVGKQGRNISNYSSFWLMEIVGFFSFFQDI